MAKSATRNIMNWFVRQFKCRKIFCKLARKKGDPRGRPFCFIIPSMFQKFRRIWILPVALLLVAGIYFLPPVHSRLAWRLDNLRSRVIYFFKPPNQAVFQPAQQADFESILATTRAEFAQTLTPEAMGTPFGTTIPDAGPTTLPTITPTP